MTADIVRKGVRERPRPAGRRKQSTCCSSTGGRFEHPAWLDALHEMARLKRGRADRRSASPISTPRIWRWRWPTACRSPPTRCLSRCVDRRAAGALSDRLPGARASSCSPTAPLAAASSPSKWLGQPEPTAIADWSRSKYKRFIDAARRLGRLPGDSARRRRGRDESTASRSSTSPRVGCLGPRRRRCRRSSARGLARASTAPTI